MEKTVDIINNSYQTIKSIMLVIDNFILDIDNKKLKKLCTKKTNDYEELIDECRLIMKSYKKEIEDIGFFEKYQNLISLKIAKLNTKSSFEIAKNIYLAVVETLPDLYHLLINTNEELEIAKRLINTNEDFINSLKTFFVLNEEN